MHYRSAAMAAAMWACHLAGCIYTPINPSLPSLSKHFILENTRSRFFICSSATLPDTDSVPDGVRIIVVDTVTLHPSSHFVSCSPRFSATDAPSSQASLPDLFYDGIDNKSLLELQQLLEQALGHRAAQPDDVAYYIHTSGSTGKPKCVVHVHSSLDWHSHVTLLGSGLTRVDDVCLQAADCSFDLHIRDIFCFISTGGHVITIPSAALTDMQLLCDLFQRHRCNLHVYSCSSCRL
jgi:non-ribosomal peptide synthetase component F